MDAILAAAAGEQLAGSGRTVAERGADPLGEATAWLLLLGGLVVLLIAATRESSALLVRVAPLHGLAVGGPLRVASAPATGALPPCEHRRRVSPLPSSALDAAWDAHCLPRERREAVWTGAVLAVLTVGEAPVEVALEPGILRYALPARAVCFLAIIAAALWARRARSVRAARVAMATAYLVTAAGGAPLVLRAEHFDLYLGGYAFLFWGVGLGTVWPTAWGAAVMAAMMAILGAAAALLPGRTPWQLAGSFGHLATVAVIGTAAIRARRRNLREVFGLYHELAARNAELSLALDRVKTLSGLLPVCAWCRRVRDDAGYWQEIERYLAKHHDTQFTHGMCPDCLDRQLAAEGLSADPAAPGKRQGSAR